MFRCPTVGGAVRPGLTAQGLCCHSSAGQTITITLVYLEENQSVIAITDKWTHTTP